MLPDAPVTATLIVFFQLRVSEASSCNDIMQTIISKASCLPLQAGVQQSLLTFVVS